MSDLPNGLPPLDPAGLEAARARTVARGRQLQRRRRGLLGGAATAAVVVLVGGVLALADGPDRRDRVDVTDDDRSTTTTVDRTTSTRPDDDGTTTTSVTTGAPAETTTTTEATEATEPPAPPDDEPPADEPQPQCTSVTDGGGPVVADWSLYWQTEPAANDPMTIELCLSDVAPAPGQPIRMDVTIDDPDALLSTPSGRGFCYVNRCEGSWSNGDTLAAGGPPLDYEVPNEPRPTPPERPGHATWYSEWAYDHPGTYTVTVTFFSPFFDFDGDGNVVPSPYRSVATATMTVTVA